MPKEPRNIPEESFLHIAMRGNNKRCLFRRNCDFRYFKNLLIKYKKKFNVPIYHYVLMKNHVHLCIKASGKTVISKMMQGIELSYNYYQKYHRGYVGHLWQGRFKSYVIADDVYLLTVALYIEKNPFEAGVVKDPIDYPWSSYGYYVIGAKDPLVDTNPLYIEMGKDREERSRHYVELMKVQIKKCTA